MPDHVHLTYVARSALSRYLYDVVEPCLSASGWAALSRHLDAALAEAWAEGHDCGRDIPGWGDDYDEDEQAVTEG